MATFVKCGLCSFVGTIDYVKRLRAYLCGGCRLKLRNVRTL